MLLSRPTTYAIRAVLCLARQNSDEPLLAPSIAKAEQLPASFLSKLLRTLSEAGILHSSRGPGGGFRLAKAANEINLQSISVLFDGLALANECLLGYGKCEDSTPCPIHKLWGPRKSEVEEFLTGTTIADLLALDTRRLAPILEEPRRGRRKINRSAE
ncbi:MAG: Rrf2 family transcriptional regulator [Calditrichaeota bacterium]|nr:Rrf2 family transcriptional regulator [Calditrichota bacterium]MCB9365713.1 Rrf2 family transcriptional regulator [Calditrichota bacterium]